MQRQFLLIGSLLALLAVLLGAFGAHGLQGQLTKHQIEIYQTGVRYQFYHAFAILIVAILCPQFSGKQLRWAGRLFTAGVLFFSGSIYLLACKDLLGLDSFQGVLGPITPIGGVFFMAGWVMVFLAALKNK